MHVVIVLISTQLNESNLPEKRKKRGNNDLRCGCECVCCHNNYSSVLYCWSSTKRCAIFGAKNKVLRCKIFLIS